MEVGFLLRGVIIGFAVAAPVGPIGVLCIRRTLVRGRAAGLVTGLGAATADALYGCIAGFGLVFVSDFLTSQGTWLRLIGGAFLLYLGARTFLASPTEGVVSAQGDNLAAAYASTFFLTLTNPLTILSFAAIFAGLGVGSARGNYISAATLVLGVFLGSALWWLLLSGATGLFRDRLSPRGLWWMNRVSGAIIVGFGLIALFAP